MLVSEAPIVPLVSMAFDGRYPAACGRFHTQTLCQRYKDENVLHLECPKNIGLRNLNSHLPSFNVRPTSLSRSSTAYNLLSCSSRSFAWIISSSAMLATPSHFRSTSCTMFDISSGAEVQT